MFISWFADQSNLHISDLGVYSEILYVLWLVVVAQLVEQLLLTPEIHGSNPVIGKFYLLLTILKGQI